MEREDPLERLAREEAEKKNNSGLKNTTVILAVVAAVLAAALAFVWIKQSKLVGELQDEKEDLTAQIVTLQGDYESLSSDYDDVNAQLDSSREEIVQLVERIKKTEATNRAKMRQYEKELGTLRSIMKGYIVQIDSLNNLNHTLTVAAANARREAAASKKQNQELTAQVEDLSGQVAAGSVLKARGLRADAYNSADKIVDKSNKVARLLVNLSLIENALAPKGPVMIYVRVTDPNGQLLNDGNNLSFVFNGETLSATAGREIDYEGSEVDLSIYVNNIPAYSKGIYTIEAYTAQAKLGSAELLLR